MREALESWNQTGAFTFQLVTSEEEADILLTEMDDSTVSAAGEAESPDQCLNQSFQTGDRSFESLLSIK